MAFLDLWAVPSSGVDFRDETATPPIEKSAEVSGRVKAESVA
jgi:hypothetical protein